MEKFNLDGEYIVLYDGAVKIKISEIDGLYGGAEDHTIRFGNNECILVNNSSLGDLANYFEHHKHNCEIML